MRISGGRNSFRILNSYQNVPPYLDSRVLKISEKRSPSKKMKSVDLLIAAIGNPDTQILLREISRVKFLDQEFPSTSPKSYSLPTLAIKGTLDHSMTEHLHVCAHT